MPTAGSVSAINEEHYVVDVHAGHHRLTSDEPVAAGGTDAGPGPYSFVLAGLAACTAITLRMYADRKGWPLASIRVHLVITAGEETPDRITREITLSGDLDSDQRSRLAAIAEKTPVTRTLKAGVTIDTTMA